MSYSNYVKNTRFSNYNAFTKKYLNEIRDRIIAYDYNKGILSMTQRAHYLRRFFTYIVNNMNKINPVSRCGNNNCFNVFHAAIERIDFTLKEIKRNPDIKNKDYFKIHFEYCGYMIRDYLQKNNSSNIIQNKYLDNYKFVAFRRSPRLNKLAVARVNKHEPEHVRRSPRLNQVKTTNQNVVRISPGVYRFDTKPTNQNVVRISPGVYRFDTKPTNKKVAVYLPNSIIPQNSIPRIY